MRISSKTRRQSFLTRSHREHRAFPAGLRVPVWNLGRGRHSFPYPLPRKFTQNLKIYGTVGEMGAVGVTSVSCCSMPGSGSRKGLSLGTSITLMPGANCWMYS